MRDKPEKLIDPSSGYPTQDALEWESDYAREQLTAFMDKMGEEIFVKHGIEICNKYGNKHFKTREDLLKFLEECPKYMKAYFDMHGGEVENEQKKKPMLNIVVDDECLDD